MVGKLVFTISSPREARRRTRENIEQGAEVIKTWLGLTLDDLTAPLGEEYWMHWLLITG